MADDLGSLFDKQFGGAPAVAPSAQPTPTPPVAASPQGNIGDAFDAQFGGAQAKTQDTPDTSSTVDWLRTLAGNAIEGIPIIGPPIQRGTEQLAGWTARQLGLTTPEATTPEAMKKLDVSEAASNPNAATAGKLIGGVGGYTAAVMLAPAAFGMAGASLPVSMAASGLTNALVSGADAYMRGEDPVAAAEAGGVIGTIAPGIGSAAGRLFRNTIQPSIAQLADLAINKYGIPLGPDLLSTNPMVRFASSIMNNMPLTGGAAAKASRNTAFWRAFSARMGENADAVSTDVMSNAKTRIGAEFNYAAKNTPVLDGSDPAFRVDVNNIWNDIQSPSDRALTADERNVVENNIQDVLDLFRNGNGEISGQQYQQLTREGTKLDKATKSSNPNIRYYANQFEDALNGLLMRQAPPDAAARLATARQQWWVMKTIEPLVEKSPFGDIPPSSLLGAVRANTNGSLAYGGGGDVAELARIGAGFLNDARSSGTSERELIMDAIIHGASKVGGVMGFLGAEGAGALTSGIGSMPSLAIGLGVPYVIGRGIASAARNPWIGNRLVQGALHGPGPFMSSARQVGSAVLPGAAQQTNQLVKQAIPTNNAESQGAQ